MWHDFLPKLKSGLVGRGEGFCVCEPEQLMSALAPAHPFVRCDSLPPVCMHAQVAQSCPTLCYPLDSSPPGSTVHGILQAWILEWVAMPSSRGSSWPRDWTHMSPALAGGFLTTSAIWEALYFLSQVQFQIPLPFLPLTLPSDSFSSLHY